MSSLNNVSFIGNLVTDPEIKNINNGDTQRTLFVNISTWNQDLIDNVSNLSSGDQVYISGRLEIRAGNRTVTSPKGEVFSLKTDYVAVIADNMFSTSELDTSDLDLNTSGLDMAAEFETSTN
jgi:single-stranded DNA-binding protein